MEIKGLQKISMVDFPGKIAATVFLGGCNMRCGYCFNADLVLQPGKLPNINKDKFLEFLDDRKHWLDGICVSGGEPTLHKNLPEFCKTIKEKGFLVKLDTNGTNPEMLEQLLEQKLVDFVAMDIKAAPDRYGEATNSETDMEALQKSINIIREKAPDYEFRSTLFPKFFSEDDARKIGEWLKGSKKYVLQQFRNQKTLDSEAGKATPLPDDKLKELKKILEPYFDVVEIRNM